ncbi:hypothetical protein X943_001853 [Babesia divergens]|uniref:Uncharacterized protein n=1 Tax=Babesia divergens TaxID=32595 RepID=A0AAD9GAD8_BABDI|nr:hypothetical protein X943_001853 [Babesia divergens]
MDSIQGETIAVAGLSLDRLNSDRHGLKNVIAKPQGMVCTSIRLGWDIRDDPATFRSGRRIYKQEHIALKEIMEEPDDTTVDFCPQLPIHRKKQPDIPEDVKRRLYGVPGQNIFTYELDKPRSRHVVPEHFDVSISLLSQPILQVGMIPKEEVDEINRRSMFLNTYPQGSLEVCVWISSWNAFQDSLLPKEGHTIPLRTKKLSSKTNISHIEVCHAGESESLVQAGYVAPEQPVKTTRLSPLKYATNLETGLLPAVEERIHERRHFSPMNAHCYDFLKGE